MKIILATGIYPPDIGGPATYVPALAAELTKKGIQIVVLTYGTNENQQSAISKDWPVIRISKAGGPILRWLRYAAALRRHASDADLVYAFSPVSVGIPLRQARLRQPKTLLRLGGDFLWERYTERGGILSLREWYEQKPSAAWLTRKLLQPFDQLIFSTAFQREIYQRHIPDLPPSTVIENAIPNLPARDHRRHTPFRLLSLGRLVRCRNIGALISAVEQLPEARLTIVGEGPEKSRLQSQTQRQQLEERILFIDAVHGEDKVQMFADHDLLVIPSLSDVSPNAALEARAAGLPVLLTKETGLSEALADGMSLRDLRTADQIVTAIKSVIEHYDEHAAAAAKVQPTRDWTRVAREHTELFQQLISQ